MFLRNLTFQAFSFAALSYGVVFCLFVFNFPQPAISPKPVFVFLGSFLTQSDLIKGGGDKSDYFVSPSIAAMLKGEGEVRKRFVVVEKPVMGPGIAGGGKVQFIPRAISPVTQNQYQVSEDISRQEDWAAENPFPVRLRLDKND